MKFSNICVSVNSATHYLQPFSETITACLFQIQKRCFISCSQQPTLSYNCFTLACVFQLPILSPTWQSNPEDEDNAEAQHEVLSIVSFSPYRQQFLALF